MKTLFSNLVFKSLLILVLATNAFGDDGPGNTLQGYHRFLQQENADRLPTGQAHILKARPQKAATSEQSSAQLIARAGKQGWLQLDKGIYRPSENIRVTFGAPDSFSGSAWIGIIPSNVPHGSEAQNDKYDLSYQYLRKKTAGQLTFQAPDASGSYDMRMHDTDSNGTEVASVTFRVEHTSKGISLQLDKGIYRPSENIRVTFSAPASFANTAWIGIIPSAVPHGSEAQNDKHDLSYQYLRKKTAGQLIFRAPDASGKYDIRMHDSDSNGTEVATVPFQVAASNPSHNEPLSATARPNSLAGWIRHIQSGALFIVVFDKTAGKFDDSFYSGDWRTDPMGSLKGGETYRIRYSNGRFTCPGYNQQKGGQMTHTDGGAKPEDGVISLWGRIYNFDASGNVWDPDYGIVGHLKVASNTPGRSAANHLQPRFGTSQ